MRKIEKHMIPVVDEEDRLNGIVSLTDIATSIWNFQMRWQYQILKLIFQSY